MPETTVGSRSGRLCPKCGARLDRHEPACAACLLETALDEPPQDEAPDRPGVRELGDYELLEEVGRGGQGIVYRARQKSLKRVVALKVMPLGHWSNDSHLKRFRLEAEATAALDHPNIVPVYEVGTCEGWCYFAMKFIAGRRLDEVIRAEPPPRRTAEMLAKLARTLHYAHQRGILHRDIKPGNVLVDANGEPHLTDFGLAKLAASEANVTRTDALLGTPAYMAPEQASGGASQITTGADIYALGAVLYEMLTGQPPFTGSTAIEVVQHAAQAEPRRPADLRRGIGRDVETICLKCLEKAPERRYVSALALAEDLERFLAGEPIRAREISPAERVWRWCRRRPALAGVGALALTSVLTIAIGAPIFALRIRAAETQAREDLRRAYLAQARAQRLGGERGRRAECLRAIAAAARMRPSLELRNEAIAALALADIGPSLLVRQGTERFDRVVLDPAFSRCAVFREMGGVEIHSFPDQRMLATLPLPPYHGAQGSFSPDGNWLAAVASGGRTFLWNLARLDEAPRADLPRVLDALRSVTFSPDSRVFAVAATNGSIHFYNLESQEERPPLPVPGAGYCLGFDPQGTKLAVMIGGTVGVWDLAARKRLRSISHSAAGVCFAWHPAGRHIGVGFDNGELWLWDTQTGVETPMSGHSAYVCDVSFDPTGTLMASVGWDGKAQFWNGREQFKDGTPGRPLFASQGSGLCQFCADGTRVAFLREQGLLEIAPVTRSGVYQQWTSARVTHPHLTGVDVSPDGRWFAYGDREHWFLCESNGREVAAMPMPNGGWPKFHPNGRAVFTLTPDTVLRWPIETSAGSNPRIGQPTPLVSLPGSEWQRSAVSADGQLMALAGHHRNLLVDLRDPAQQTEFAQGLRESYAALSPDKKWVAVASHHGNGVTVWNTSDGQLLHHVVTNDNAHIAVSADGRTLATATVHECCWWNTENWQLLKRFPLELPGEVSVPLTFSGDGQLFALVVDRQRIALFDARNGDEIATLTPPQLLNLEPIVFSAASDYLLAGTQSGIVAMWNLRALRRELAALGLDWPDQLTARAAPLR